MTGSLKVIAKYGTPEEGHLLRNRLLAAGIPAFLDGETAGSAWHLTNAIGGVIFGIGMAILGYCPGTGVAALGDGSRHAGFGVLGMLAGAAAYAEVYPIMQKTILAVVDFGTVTLADVTGISPWAFIAALIVIAAVLFALLRGRDLTPEPAAK